MADGLNRVHLIGNLGADPDLKMTSGGQAVLKLRMATAETYFDRNKTKQERTEWHSVVIWGKRAEGLAKFLAKGAKIYVEGRLQTQSWEDKQSGQKKFKTEVNAINVIALGSSRGGGKGGGSSHDDGPPDDYDYGDGGGSSSGGGGGASGGSKPDDDDDIPFLRCVIGDDTEAWWRFR